MSISQKIKKIRIKFNLSQERFGQKIGVSGKSVSAYETGRATPSIKILSQIAKTFNVSFNDLMPNENKDYLYQKLMELEKNLLELKENLISLISEE